MASSPYHPNYVFTEQFPENESQEEELNILDDFREFLGEYEETVKEAMGVK